MTIHIGLVSSSADDSDNLTREGLEKVCRDRWFGEEAADELALLKESMSCMLPAQLDRFLASNQVDGYVRFHTRQKWLYRTVLEPIAYSMAKHVGILQRLSELGQVDEKSLKAGDLLESLATAAGVFSKDWNAFQERFRAVPKYTPEEFRDWLMRLKEEVETFPDAELHVG